MSARNASPAAADAITVAIPVLNGARHLGEVLGAVRAQRIEREPEVLVIDSGSTDGSVGIAREHGARVIEIGPGEFNHGRTRNLAISEASGDHIALLTQDATPMGEDWLASLLEGFAHAHDVALVFGPQLARPGSSHMIARDLRDHFATWGDGERVDVQRLDRSPEGMQRYRRSPGAIQFFSDANGAIARWAWERIPFREVDYAEDQLLAREMIEAGYAKVFHPRAAVYHSHDYPPLGFLRRFFDEYRGLREVLGHTEPLDLDHIGTMVEGSVKADREYLLAQGVRGPDLRRALRRSTLHHFIRAIGAGLGSRADRIPAPARRLLSLEGRSSFEPVALPGSVLSETVEDPSVPPAGGAGDPRAARPRERKLAVRGPRRQDPRSGRFGFLEGGFEDRPPVLEPRPKDGIDPEQLTLAWVVPPWRRGSGGHATLFRLIKLLEERGHRNSIFLFDPYGDEKDASPGSLAEHLREHFVELEAPLFIGFDHWIGGDIGIATEWRTGYPLRDLPGCYEKAYVVSDFEPDFFPRSARSLWAERTYSLGFRCVTITAWLAAQLRERCGTEARHFDLGTDLETYGFAGQEQREPATVIAYARQETPRRAVELAFAALTLLKRRRPELRIVLFGSERSLRVPFEHENAGVLPAARLAELYRRASVGLAFSLTNLSIVSQEMMASGLPVVELSGGSASAELGAPGELVAQAAADPEAVAREVERLLDEPGERAAMVRRARAFVETRTWERSAGQLEDALRTFVATPADGTHSRARTRNFAPRPGIGKMSAPLAL